ncbi:MAG TPA: 5'/3'-nucleotidase SurE [Pirellulales bacterium]|nr:5'/3'-nucleotidase SurE [Pirellulales bacterium]
MKFLVTNDDGIDAPGLAALDRLLAPWGERLVIASSAPRSGCSHQATTDRPLKIARRGDGWHAIDGTPVDCTRIGLNHLNEGIDWVLAGINQGGNLGADVFMSGTVAAIREAALLGKPGIAVSQYRRRREEVDWSRAARWTSRVLQFLFAKPPAPATFWNVNLPDPETNVEMPDIVDCPVDPHPLPVAYRRQAGELVYQGDYQNRRREPGSDVQLCFAGNVTVSRITLACSADLLPASKC